MLVIRLTQYHKGGEYMKKEYLSPEIEVIKFSFEPLLTMVQSCTNVPEEFESSGNFDGDDI
mgnify:CR=1 FL=1